MEKLDGIDKKILRELQGNLPIAKRPFLEAAKKVGIAEEDFFSRVKKLIEKGIIRKFGLRIDSRKVGFASTLVAMKVAKHRIDAVAEQLNSYESITHNYARDHEYNLWFTVIDRDEKELGETLERIKREVEHEEMLNLPVLRKFKINVKFDIR
ncbi:MAG: Lrp/AsnC family transcriptional regulator [Euryarchaeota archaeon]|nr:Lrp/AsnC family transcriptional regulator [Euryarchaeota archaeon]